MPEGDVRHIRRIGLQGFFIRLNNRKITEDFVKTLGISNVPDVFRSIDKLEKIGADEVSKELKGKGIQKSAIESILNFVQIKDLEKVKKYISSEGIKELEKILDLTKNYKGKIQPDMSLVRGLDYYTGPVFEISLGKDVSVGGGGRYEDLVETLGGKKMPATGISIGVTRLVAVMEERKMFNLEKTNCKIFVVSVNESVKKDVAKLVDNLRRLEVPSEFDIMSRSLSKQMSYINSRGIPFALVIGEKELEAKKAKIRDMKSGKEEDIWLDKLEDVKEFIS